MPRLHHPKATLREMETELDARWARVRSRLLEDMALHSTAAGWADAPAREQPSCPDCGTPLHERGRQSRTLHAHGSEPVTLTRAYGLCPVCDTGLRPKGTRPG